MGDIQVEVWVNKWGDVAYFVGDLFVIYDKCDRLEPTTFNLKKPCEIDVEGIKLEYYKNGFRPEAYVKDYKDVESIIIDKYEAKKYE